MNKNYHNNFKKKEINKSKKYENIKVSELEVNKNLVLNNNLFKLISQTDRTKINNIYNSLIKDIKLVMKLNKK